MPSSLAQGAQGRVPTGPVCATRAGCEDRMACAALTMCAPDWLINVCSSWCTPSGVVLWILQPVVSTRALSCGSACRPWLRPAFGRALPPFSAQTSAEKQILAGVSRACSFSEASFVCGAIAFCSRACTSSR